MSEPQKTTKKPSKSAPVKQKVIKKDKVTTGTAEVKEVTITPPFGYKALHALNRHDFVRMHSLGEVPTFAAANEILPLTYSEFFVASSDYPIVFIQPNGSADFMPVVLVGLERGMSLFAQHDGKVWRWDTNHYLPAYVRRHPFCMSTVNGEAGLNDELLVCVDKDYVSDKAAAQHEQLFNGEAPSERWGVIEEFLQGYQTDIAATAEFTKALDALGLLQPISASLMPVGAEAPMTVDGMFGVDEDKLNALEDGVLAELHRKGYLPRIYAHHKSLQNFTRLMRRLEEQKFSAKAKQASFNA